MQVRTVTLFVPGRWLERGPAKGLARGAQLCQRVASRLIREAWGVQTRRLATPPWPQWTTPKELVAKALHWEGASLEKGAQFLSLGPVRAGDPPAALAAAGEALKATRVSFFSAELSGDRGPEGEPALAAAKAVNDIGHATASGYGNLRFAALANCGPGTPFFPTAYGDMAWARPRVALGLEWCDVALEAFKSAPTGDHEAAARGLRDRLTAKLWALERLLKEVCGQLDLDYGGLDCSLTPAIGAEQTAGAALEALGCTLGEPGSLAAVALVTGVLRSLPVQRCGYCGVMLPLLEDPLLVRRAAEGRLTLKDLLLYAAVCGCGLDTVPLPGDTPPQRLAALLTDIATLAIRLDKPLSARLFVVPGKAAGELTEFDSPYLYNGPVLALGG